MDAKREGETLSVAEARDAADAGETGRRNDGEWYRGLLSKNDKGDCAFNWTGRSGSRPIQPLVRRWPSVMREPLVSVVANVLVKARAVEQCGTEPSRLQAYQQEEAFTHVAMDGKSIRGTLGHESEGQPSVHLLSLYECQSGIVLTRASCAKQGK